MIVLSENILEMEEMDIVNIEVEMTMIDGNIEYQK